MQELSFKIYMRNYCADIAFVLWCSFLLYSCHGRIAEKSLVFQGVLDGVPDSTLILVDLDSVKDSTFVISGRFRFEIPGAGHPLRVMLHSKDFRNYRFLWLDGTTNTFKAENGKFQQGELLGSVTQSMYDAYQTELAPIQMAIDSLRLHSMPGSQITGHDKARAYMDSVNELRNAVRSKFIRRYSKSVLGAFILNASREEMHVDSVQTLLAELPKTSSYYREVERFLSLRTNVNLGERYADFSQPDTTGSMISVSTFKGKIVLIEFWASWCAPCVRENPALEMVQRKYRERGLVVFGVSLDTKRSNWINAIRRDSLTWVNVSELKGDKNSASIMYGIVSIPDNFLLDRNGTIVGRNLRGEALTKELDKLL